MESPLPYPCGQQPDAQVQPIADGVDHRSAGAAEVQPDGRIGDVCGKDGPPLAGDLQQPGRSQIDAQDGEKTVDL